MGNLGSRSFIVVMIIVAECFVGLGLGSLEAAETFGRNGKCFLLVGPDDFAPTAGWRLETPRDSETRGEPLLIGTGKTPISATINLPAGTYRLYLRSCAEVAYTFEENQTAVVGHLES